MSARWPPLRRRDEDQPTSPAISRLLAMGFLVAAGLGFLLGVGWMVLQAVRTRFGG